MINNDFFNVIKTLTKGQNVTFYYLDVNANRKEIICRYTSASKVGNVLYGKVKPNWEQIKQLDKTAGCHKYPTVKQTSMLWTIIAKTMKLSDVTVLPLMLLLSIGLVSDGQYACSPPRPGKSDRKISGMEKEKLPLTCSAVNEHFTICIYFLNNVWLADICSQSEGKTHKRDMEELKENISTWHHLFPVVFRKSFSHKLRKRLMFTCWIQEFHQRTHNQSELGFQKVAGRCSTSWGTTSPCHKRDFRRVSMCLCNSKTFWWCHLLF